MAIDVEEFVSAHSVSYNGPPKYVRVKHYAGWPGANLSIMGKRKLALSSVNLDLVQLEELRDAIELALTHARARA